MDENNLYYYKGLVRSVYDGDTIRIDIDLGMNTTITNEPVRLNRINAPEVRGAEREKGLLSRDYLRSRIDGKEVLLQTEKDDKGKYGRYIVDIWLKENDNYTNINDEMVTERMAVYKSY